MKNTIFSKIIVFGAFLGLISCSRMNSFGSGYVLNDSDSDHIYITRTVGNQTKIEIDQQIGDWKKIGRYVFVLRMVATSPDCYGKGGDISIITHYSDSEEFWIIDLEAGSSAGPLSKNDYAIKLRQLGLSGPTLLRPSHYRPNTEQFQKMFGKCKRG